MTTYNSQNGKKMFKTDIKTFFSIQRKGTLLWVSNMKEFFLLDKVLKGFIGFLTVHTHTLSLSPWFPLALSLLTFTHNCEHSHTGQPSFFLEK